MNKRPAPIAIIGAKPDGQMPVLWEAITASDDFEPIVLIDDNPDLHDIEFQHLKVAGGLNALPSLRKSAGINAVAIAIGDPQARAQVAQICRDMGMELPTFIHPSACVSQLAKIEEGSYIGAGVHVLPGAQVGELARINAGVVVSHHVKVGFCNTIGPNATLTGRCRTERFVFIGAGSTILNDICIGKGSTVGAGAVVTTHVAAYMTVVGIPAKPLQKNH